MALTIAIGLPGPFEWIIIAGLGLLIFGRRLPEVGRSLGQGIVQFKKGLRGIEDEVAQVDPDDRDQSRRSLPPQGEDYKFDPHTGKPVERGKFDPYTGKPIEPSA